MRRENEHGPVFAGTRGPPCRTHHQLRGGGAVVCHVTRPQILDVASLRALPSKTVNVTFKGPHGSESHVFVGPLLVDVIPRRPHSSTQRSRTTSCATMSA